MQAKSKTYNDRCLSPVALIVLFAAIWVSGPVFAQSFFSTLLTDPTVGVDRGAASQISKTDEFATFVTADTYGSQDIGPLVLGFGLAAPDAMMDGDQLDLVVALAGQSEDDQLELRAYGVGYRLALGAPGTTVFAQIDDGSFRSGTASGLAFGISGAQSKVAIGLRKVFPMANEAKITTTAEILARHVEGELLGATVVDEDLRLIRLSALYEQGVPLLFQRRLAVSITRGLSGFGASATDNPLASSHGVTSDFFRTSMSAEFSVPLSQEIVVNAGVIGQWSQDSLPTSQRCGYGTNAYARGFDQSYVNGDRCFGGRIELGYNIEFPDLEAPKIIFTQGFIGIDSGTVVDNANAYLPQVTDNWTSLSVGVRTLRGNFLGEIAYSKILDLPAGISSQDDYRLWLRGGIKF